MTDEEINRFMYLFQVYRSEGSLCGEEHKEFKRLGEKWRKLKAEMDSRSGDLE